ncbi:MAG TPA: hypothetical protein VGM44_07670 [Polyangiaceae bacterium]|jgi:hypothetical protein
MPTHWLAEQTWSSKHFVYHARPDDDSVDASAVVELEKHAAVVAGQWLGLAQDSWGGINYFKYRDENALVAAGSPCGDRPCTVLFDSGRIEIHSPLPIDEHELTHSYVLGSTCAPPLFREGLAVSAACDPTPELSYATTADRPPWLAQSWRDFDDFSGPAPTAYQPAGVLVTWIIDHWGIASFLAFYRGLSCDMSNDQIAAAFVAHYGVALDDVWSALVSAPSRRLCSFTWGCAEASASGDVPLTNGLYGYRVAAPLTQQGSTIRAGYTPTALAPVIRACSASSALPNFNGNWPLEPDAWLPVVLAPSTADQVVALADQRGTADDPNVRLDLTVTPLPVGSIVPDGACAQASPLTVDDQRATVLFWPHPSAMVFQIQSSTAPAAAEAMIRDDFAGPDLATVEACQTCTDGELQNCADAMLAPPTNAPWLRVTWNPTLPSLLALSFEW